MPRAPSPHSASLPPVHFSQWYAWSGRLRIPGLKLPGVYLLAHFARVPRGRARPDDAHIIYIGETCRSLRGRLRRFDRSAFGKLRGHSGGRNYSKVFHGKKGGSLYVATFSLPASFGNARDYFIRFVERKVLLAYILQHGSPPVLNRK